MRRSNIVAAVAGLLVAALSGTSVARDRPFSTAKLIAMKWGPAPEERDLGTGGGNTDPGGQFSKEQIERFRCSSAGNPGGASTSAATRSNTARTDPDNEIAVAVDPTDPNHIVAGSNDYYYRFNNSTGARQAIVVTGFFTSFDGGATWIDGQVPCEPAAAPVIRPLPSTARHGGADGATGERCWSGRGQRRPG